MVEDHFQKRTEMCIHDVGWASAVQVLGHIIGLTF